MAYWQNYNELKEKGLITSVEVVIDNYNTTPVTYSVQTTYAQFSPTTGERIEDRTDVIGLAEAEKQRADLEKQWSDINAWMADALENMPPPEPVVEVVVVEPEVVVEPTPLPVAHEGTIEEVTGVEAVEVVPIVPEP